MTKIAYNACYGGFSLSNEAFEMLLDLKGIEWEKEKHPGVTHIFDYWHKGSSRSHSDYLSIYAFCENRKDPDLIKVIETLGRKANGSCADIKITELPEGTFYRIDEYDGMEAVLTVSDYDWNIA